MQHLKGCNAILTGASRGLGARLARALAGEGVNLALAARSADALENVCRESRSRGVDAVALPTDLEEVDQVEALAGKAESQLGPVDLLVNNAGVEFTAPFDESPPEAIETTVRVNLLAAMLLTRAVLPGMLARGRGHVVNMSSLAGKVGLPYQTAYASTKAGLVMFTHSLRAELVDEPVGVSVVCPGYVAEEGMYARVAEVGGPAPRLQRATTPEKVVAAVLKAIRRDAAELIVNPTPMRPLVVLREILPGSTPYLHKLGGTTRFGRRMARTLAEKRYYEGGGRSQGSSEG